MVLRKMDGLVLWVLLGLLPRSEAVYSGSRIDKLTFLERLERSLNGGNEAGLDNQIL